MEIRSGVKLSLAVQKPWWVGWQKHLIETSQSEEQSRAYKEGNRGFCLGRDAGV
jgi:hypothetical protein